MDLLRQFYIWPALALATLFWGFLSVFLSYIFPSRDLPQWCARSWARVLLWLNGSRVFVKGLENVNPNRPQIFFCNHQSWVDIVVMTATLPCPFKWISKKEVFRVPFLGWHMRRAGYVSVDRTRWSQAARSVQVAVDVAREGYSLIIFPEGTRSPDGRLLPFKRGGFVLAMRAGCPIVPVTIIGTRQVLPKGGLRIGRADIEIYMSQPVHLEGLDIREVMERVRGAISAHLPR